MKKSNDIKLDKIYESMLAEQWKNPHVHPDKVTGIDRLGKQLGSSKFIDTAAEQEYNRAVNYFKKYHPEIASVSIGSVAPIAMSAGMLLLAAQDIEKDNIEYLEHLALQTVLELPEFYDAKQAHESGDLEFDIELINDDVQVDLKARQIEDKLESMDGEEVDSLEDDLLDALSFDDVEKQKRNFINLFIQGAATEKLSLWEMLQYELKKIDEELPNIYGQLMSVAHLIYWYMPDMDMSGVSRGGEVEVDTKTDPYTIRARATIFPLLIHEIVKGLNEYVSLAGLPDSQKTAQKTTRETDTPENEVLHIMVGRAAWSRLREMFGPQEQRFIYSVWHKLVSLPAVPEDVQDGFIYVIKQLVENPNTSFVKNTIRGYIKDISDTINDFENPKYQDSSNGLKDSLDGEEYV